MSATWFCSSINSAPSSLILAQRPIISKKFQSLTCRASSSSSILDFDLYDLMGIESFSDQSQIKAAYRTLQKRCHPDIAGPAGHDMAIVLNEAYSVLSDPVSRRAYDKEQAKLTELKGYTGKPVYSVWCGSETENRAVFVDEVKCIGCLKCALCAGKTFAIESAYGRARVVAQWADAETKIQEAIEACPVDCISVVERSDLAPLEFLMSKQPRGNVRVGTRASNVFVDVKKFQLRYAEAMGKASGQNSKEKDLQNESRLSAMQAIRSISNWLYRCSPIAKAPAAVFQLTLAQTARKSSNPDIKKLREAAAARNQARNIGSLGRTRSNQLTHRDQYWVPSTHALPSAKLHVVSKTASKSEALSERETRNDQREDNRCDKRENDRRDTVVWRIPTGTAILGAVVVWGRVKDGVNGVTEHIGGSLALSVVNSSWLQVVLAGITWYFIGVALVELVEATKNRQ